MRKVYKLILFEPNTTLATRMTSYWSEVEKCSFEYELYTVEELFFIDIEQLNADIWLVDESIYEKLLDRKPNGIILNFTKELGEESSDSIFKYQSIQLTTNLIEELLGITSSTHTSIHSRVYTFYTPSRCPLESTLALEFSRILSRQHKTLFIQLKPYSDLEFRTNQTFTKDISDLLFYLENNTNQSPSKIQKHMMKYSALDILVPPKHAENLIEVSAQQWKDLLDTIAYIYDAIVIELSNSVRGIHTLLHSSDYIITCIPHGEVYRNEYDIYTQNLEQLGEDVIIKNTVELPIGEEVHLGQYASHLQYLRQYRVIDKLLGEVGGFGDLSLREV
ncbi:MAG: hypothetical protein R3Y47_00525 [Lachnospiraceae bacterium]